MIIVVKTFIDKTAYLMIPDLETFASSFTLSASEFLDSELEKIQGQVDRKLTKAKFDEEFEKLPSALKEFSKTILAAGLDAEFDLTNFGELIINIKGTSTLVTSTSFH